MRRTTITLLSITLLAILPSASTSALAAPPAPPAEPDPFELTAPTIIEISKKKQIRVAYDVKDDVWDAGIGKAPPSANTATTHSISIRTSRCCVN